VTDHHREPIPRVVLVWQLQLRLFPLRELTKTFKVLYFASAKDATGLSTECLSIPETSEEQSSISITELFGILEARHPKLRQKRILSSVAVAVNLEYAEMEDGRIKAGDEVAIIPPVSGG
jgi:molybdopterin converting factor subunit 1